MREGMDWVNVLLFGGGVDKKNVDV